MNINSISISLKGENNSENQDFAISHVREDGAELWLIADGATKAKKSGEFVKILCEKLSEIWINTRPFLTVDDIPNILLQVHNNIKRDYICSKGCLLIFASGRDLNDQRCFYLGDCRLGILEKTETENKISWLTYPHSLIYSLEGKNEEKLCLDSDRHILNYILKGKRFEVPKELQISINPETPFILASDGFWSHYPAFLPLDLTKKNIENFLQSLNPKDDCTVLIRT